MQVVLGETVLPVGAAAGMLLRGADGGLVERRATVQVGQSTQFEARARRRLVAHRGGVNLIGVQQLDAVVRRLTRPPVPVLQLADARTRRILANRRCRLTGTVMAVVMMMMVVILMALNQTTKQHDYLHVMIIIIKSASWTS